jgi:hypothetical protein
MGACIESDNRRGDEADRLTYGRSGTGLKNGDKG